MSPVTRPGCKSDEFSRNKPKIHAILCVAALSTEDKLEYNFYPVTAGQIQFRVKAANDAHVALTTGPQEGDPMYEVRDFVSCSSITRERCTPARTS